MAKASLKDVTSKQLISELKARRARLLEEMEEMDTLLAGSAVKPVASGKAKAEKGSNPKYQQGSNWHRAKYYKQYKRVGQRNGKPFGEGKYVGPQSKAKAKAKAPRSKAAKAPAEAATA